MRLERSCDARAQGDWLVSEEPAFGVARLRARLQRAAHARHRHDTYTVALTESGVQEFGYRGSVHRSLPGQIVLLHPDEAHDGRAGTAAGFAYRTLYVEPSLLLDALHAIAPRAAALPFVADPVRSDPALASGLATAFDGPMELLRAHELALAVALAVARLDGRASDAGTLALDDAALDRVREHLARHCQRVVRADELEALSGLSRFVLCAQFKQRFGTTPYRYLLMRRLERVRARLRQGEPLAAVAADAGFADQAHMTRLFKAAVGFTPGQYAALHAGH
ncbi:MAG TPA: AraC family transcriptional regulator [Burkholderiaceae bacterium]|nr:AraC family transcriptional regulator [Burkholderiaceae bacterium]